MLHDYRRENLRAYCLLGSASRIPKALIFIVASEASSMKLLHSIILGRKIESQGQQQMLSRT
jgi:hypothetical protein